MWGAQWPPTCGEGLDIAKQEGLDSMKFIHCDYENHESLLLLR